MKCPKCQSNKVDRDYGVETIFRCFDCNYVDNKEAFK